MNTQQVLDLIVCGNWEECIKVEGPSQEWSPSDSVFASGIYQYIDWYYDGEMSEFDK